MEAVHQSETEQISFGFQCRRRWIFALEMELFGNMSVAGINGLIKFNVSNLGPNQKNKIRI